MSDFFYGDLQSLTTHDGEVMYFDNNPKCFLSYGNYGAPPTQFITRRGYKQDGVTEVDYQLDPRPISVTIYLPLKRWRQEYWDQRAQLHELLRPNRGGPLTLLLQQPDGTKRALKVRANPGAVFAPQDPRTPRWDIEETVEFVAFDPTWFNPVEQIASAAAATSNYLIFPFAFSVGGNLQFGYSGSRFDNTITYVGTWKTFPRLYITAPYTSVRIEHLELNISIALSVPLASGGRIIDLTQGAQAVTDLNGEGDYFGELTPDSNLVEFAILPAPLLAGGVNTIRGVLQGATGASDFEVRYYERYFAL